MGYLLLFIYLKKLKTMKKLLFVCALGAFVACKNGEATDANKDSAAVTTPPPATVEPTPAPVDTTKAAPAVEPTKMEAGKEAKAEVKEATKKADKMEKK